MRDKRLMQHRLDSYCELHSLQSYCIAYREKTSDCKQEGGAAQDLMCLCFLAEWRCASRPQAGEHPFGSRFECKGKMGKTD